MQVPLPEGPVDFAQRVKNTSFRYLSQLLPRHDDLDQWIVLPLYLHGQDLPIDLDGKTSLLMANVAVIYGLMDEYEKRMKKEAEQREKARERELKRQIAEKQVADELEEQKRRDKEEQSAEKKKRRAEKRQRKEDRKQRRADEAARSRSEQEVTSTEPQEDSLELPAMEIDTKPLVVAIDPPYLPEPLPPIAPVVLVDPVPDPVPILSCPPLKIRLPTPSPPKQETPPRKATRIRARPKCVITEATAPPPRKRIRPAIQPKPKSEPPTVPSPSPEEISPVDVKPSPMPPSSPPATSTAFIVKMEPLNIVVPSRPDLVVVKEEVEEPSSMSPFHFSPLMIHSPEPMLSDMMPVTSMEDMLEPPSFLAKRQKCSDDESSMIEMPALAMPSLSGISTDTAADQFEMPLLTEQFVAEGYLGVEDGECYDDIDELTNFGFSC